MVVTEDFFRQFTRKHTFARFRGISGTCLWKITGGGDWLLKIDQGEVMLIDDSDKKPIDCTIVCDQDTFVQIEEKKLNGFTAYLQGRLAINGRNISVGMICLRLLQLQADRRLRK